MRPGNFDFQRVPTRWHWLSRHRAARYSSTTAAFRSASHPRRRFGAHSAYRTMATMDVTHETDDEQTRRWNGVAGRAWVDAQQLLDQMFKPLEELLVEAVAAASRNRVLDVGCGTGSTTLAVARPLGSKGHCIGIRGSSPSRIVSGSLPSWRRAVGPRSIFGRSMLIALCPKRSWSAI